MNAAWRDPSGIRGWFSYTTHQAIGLRYIVTAFIFLLVGGVEALLMRIQLAHSEQQRPRPRSLQPDLHHARHHHDVPLRRADDGRHGRLPCAADAGNAQRRLSSPQRLRVLDVRFRRPVSLLRRLHQYRTRCRLVRLYPALRSAILSRQARRFLGADDHFHRSLRALRRHRAHRHHLETARARHVAQPHPALLLGMLVQSFMVIFAMPAVMVASTVLLLNGPHRRHAFRQSRGRRRPPALPACLLVLRPPRGLHHLHSSARHGLFHHRNQHPPRHLRLSRHGAVRSRHGLHCASAFGCTTCSPRACRKSAKRISPRPA